MPHYKDNHGGVHFLESIDHESLLPAGCIPITDADAAEADAATVAFFADGYEKLRARR